ncbi:MAG: hypothetical protein NTY01_10220 [Verrucomicrobia bacterium]|nr:hypothetical protein [Verrucomicrobiota bacterium]
MKERKRIPGTCNDPLTEFDWNFDKVPDNELVACCYWEYARESAFLRRLRQRCYANYRAGGRRDDELHSDMQKVQSIGQIAGVFLHGFFCPQDGVLDDALPLKPGEVHRLTGSFPKAWQALTPQERAYRARFSRDCPLVPPVPFERGMALDAEDIVKWVKARRSEQDAENEQARRKHPYLMEEQLLEMGKLRFPSILPRLIYESGREVTVVSVDWGAFTNEQIIQYFRRWVKQNRPSDVPVPSRKGHKPGDWRVQLVRLAVMRSLSRFSSLDIIDTRSDKFPAVWETKQFSRRKWRDATKWHDARREAGKLFRTIFPFLSADEKPLSWERPPAK